MKKVLLTIGLLCIVFASYSQTYESSVELNIGPGLDDFYDITVGADMNFGVTVADYFYFGSGMGLKYFKTKERNTTVYDESTSTESYKNVFIPIYARVKAKFTKTKVSPFVMFDAGYMFDFWRTNTTDGAFYEPAAGADIKLSDKMALRIAVGLNFQKASYVEYAMFGSMPHVILKDGYGKTVNMRFGLVF